MRCVLGLGLAAAAACGEVGVLVAPPLAPADDLIIVAHQDDDLIFMQPDMFELVHGHSSLTTVYVTAGDGGNGLAYAEGRIAAVKAAYGLTAGSQRWTCGWTDIAGHAAQHCRLDDEPVSLVFLGYPDGGRYGQLPASLLALWQGRIDHADTVSQQPARYDQAGLIATVSTIITTTRPATIHTLDLSSTHGDDHPDHLIVGALTVLAVADAGSDAAVVSYRGYNTSTDPANMPAEIFDDASLPMRAYEACQLGCGACGTQSCASLTDPNYNAWGHRRYAVAARRPPLSGVLRSELGCVVVADGNAPTIGNCADATPVAFDPGGNIRVDNSCFAVLPTGELTVGTCGAAADRDFLFDDEGHVWAGVAPARAGDTARMHGTCLTGLGGKLHASLCGADRDVRWELVRPQVTTARALVGLPAGGRAARLGDVTGDGKADLCALGPGGLFCAVGDGSGGFGLATRFDSPSAPLLIEPESLVLGDVDGDGRVDACGRDAHGITCATAASGFAAKHWSTAFARTGAATPSDRSLAIVGGTICGRDATGVVCVRRGTSSPELRSTWPAANATVWPGDLDGDHVADWCAMTRGGPACGLAAEQSITTDGVPWAFSLHAIVGGTIVADGTLADAAHGALADVSGDGRADLCDALGNTVRCAFSQGHGFGPRALMLELPPAATIDALWLGDLDGDGKADSCVASGATITCALTP